MKRIITTSAILAFSFSAMASEKFAGIHLDSSMPSSQIRTLKSDLTYLYSNQIKETDPQFQEMAGLAKVDGPHMYNWIYNRVKYIIGENYKTYGRNVVTKKGHRFPSTPLPAVVANGTNSYGAVMIMSNVGAGLYLYGKRDKVLKGLKIDRKNVFAVSPRVGILQVGEGLFLESLLINNNMNSEANKIKRLGTLFHEARHSDGHSEHVGFHHDRCPTGHALSGFYACESSSNGSYSIEAVATKTLLLNCRTCSEIDKTKLTTAIADNYSRVVVRSHVKSEEKLLDEIETFQRVVEFYENLLATNPQLKEVYAKELERLKAQLKESQDQLKELRTPMEPKKLDPKPEGTFEEVSVERSSSLMKASVNR
ncbi:MAG TPA: hypothetical protein VKY27_00955 [Bacteriovoracaceae bacterium]|nr:hypothetical protein [Bacteriovoracaceae bacterium]